MRAPCPKWVLVLLILTVLGGCSKREAVKPAEIAKVLRKPQWLKQEPLIIVGNWDDMAIFRRRVGGNPVWQEEDYRREHSEEAVRKLKDLGVTMAIIHFYKGFGLEAEKEHMQDSRELAALCKKYGIRVGVYIGSTLAYETFLREKPDAASWLVPSFLGRPVTYGSQTFRRRVYFMDPGYREYIKRVLLIAIKELKVDLIHFDNTSSQAMAPVFLHPEAVKDFRTYLVRKYSPEVLKKRFGFADVGLVEPPEWDRPMTTIDDPLFQEWTDFRCHQLAAYYREMESFIRGLNPEVAVENNPSRGISGVNTAWEQGVDYPRLLAHTDVVWTEEGNEAGVMPEGILISKIRSYKMAVMLGNSVFTYTGGSSRGGKLALAEAMAYNRQNLGMIGGGLAGYDFPEDQKRYIKFYKDHFAYYRDVESKADVAVLHSFASMAYNSDRPWQSAMLVEQALIQGKVPFEIIFDDNLKNLSKYRVLVLPDQECLSSSQMEAIRQFVSQGGGLVATEHSSLYNEWRQRRRDFGLQDLFKVNAAPWVAGQPEQLLQGPAVKREAGKGRVVYIPEIRPSVPKPPSAPMTSQYWKLPQNWQEVLSAIRWAARGSLSLEVKAPLTVTAELQEQKQQGRMLIHLVNYDAARTPLVGRVEISLLVPEGKREVEALVFSPEEEKPLKLTAAVRGGRAVFAIPRVRTYALVAVR